MSEDELAKYIQEKAPDGTNAPPPAVRAVNFILDHSAFVRGIGNVKRWFNKEYVEKNFVGRHEQVHLNIFIPTYTLHEFDFVKKGTSMLATNAREAIRFIDRFFEAGDDNADGFGHNWRENIETDSPITYNLYIEGPAEGYPSWAQCMKYKTHSPLIKEFPNFKTKFDSNLIGAEDDWAHDFDSVRSNDIKYENSSSYQMALKQANHEAEMPKRLKYLIRSCVYKQRVEALGPWQLITEDPITKIWLKSFGIDCLNVNEAELLIFQSHDINHAGPVDPRYDFYNPARLEYEPEGGILHSTVDTSSYSYTTMKTKRAKDKRAAPERVAGVVGSYQQYYTGDEVKREKFDAINYAPRGKGELWVPKKQPGRREKGQK